MSLAKAPFDVRRFERVDSTNAVARDLALKGAGEGTVVVARAQSAGRGTGARRWHSPAGGLYLSALLEPAPGRRPTDLGFLAGVAVASTLREALPPTHAVSVKWPNDCLVDDCKVAGILSEAIAGTRLCAVGIGLNVNAPAEELARIERHRFPAASLYTITGRPTDLAAIETKLLEALGKAKGRYATSGFPAIQSAWEAHCAHLGRSLRFQPPGEPALEARLLGIDDSGALVLSSGRGDRRAFAAGEIECFLP